MQEILYPEIEPYQTGYLQVSEVHSLYYEQSGNPNGEPAVFIHGGPGSGSAPIWRRLFNPSLYRIILFDQRGCGKSKPYASLHDNKTEFLIEDLELIRLETDCERWSLVGGSWGSTLAMAYAQRYPHRVKSMVLYGIFLASASEISWFYQAGANAILPDAWDEFCQMVPQDERSDMLKAYKRLLSDPDHSVRAEAARQWSMWEGRALRLIPDPYLIASFAEPDKAVAQAMIENHYMSNQCFLEENQLLNNIASIRSIPAKLVHGRYDMVCPVKTAWNLRRHWTAAELVIVPAAGHSAREEGIQQQLIDATNKFCQLD